MRGLEPEEPAAAQPGQQSETRAARRAAKREARWARPAGPKDWRYWVGGVGRVFIVTGLLMFGFVAYQLWGTGIEYARAQDRLDREFEELLASVPTPTTASTASTTSTSAPSPGPTSSTVVPASSAPPTTTVPPTVPVPAFEPGSSFARLELPTIGQDVKVVSGVSPGDLKEGPGHYPDTPMPGQLGNAAIAGHRTTYGQPFYRLDALEPGDEIIVTTVQGRFVYRVTGSEIVGPGDGQVVATTDPTVAKLTLTTCHPRWSARQRLIVYADLDASQSGPALPPVIIDDEPTVTIPGEATAATTSPAAGSAPVTGGPVTTDTTFAGDDPTVSTTPASIPADGADGGTDDGAEDVGAAADAFAHGWFSDTAAWPQVALWAVVTALIAAGGWLVARRFRRYWVGALVAIVPFVLALYFFYQNVNRLLPAAL